MRAIRFIITAVALPKGRFPGGKPWPRRGRESVTTRYSRLLIPTTALAAGERHAQPVSYYPKRKPGWRKNAAVAAYITRRDGVQRTRRVCGLSFSLRFPYTDRQQKRLFIRNFFTLQDRLDLTHEYLHLAFDGYPTGLDENYIETLTRQLLMD